MKRRSTPSRRSGQALVEYALLTAVVLFGVVFGITTGRSGSLLALLFQALEVYFESWEFLLSLPLS